MITVVSCVAISNVNNSRVIIIDKVWMYKEIMMNDDNLEFSLLTSSLLKIHSLYKFCYRLQVEPEICVVSKFEVQVKCGWGFTAIYTTSVSCY